jgi:dynein heavy chain 2
LPATANHSDFVTLIGALETTDTPEFFALPANIDRSVQRTISSNLIGQLKTLSAAATATSGFDRELWRSQLGPMFDLWERLTRDKTVLEDGGAAMRRDTSALPPVDQFVYMEYQKAVTIITRANTELMNIKKVVYGTGLLTPAIQETAAFLLRDAVPRKWESLWEGPEDPRAWLRGVALRRAALSKWMARVESGSLLSQPVNLGELFRPGTFLNALRQQTVSGDDSGISMDELHLITCWDASLLPSVRISMAASGMMLQGATFTGDGLLEPSADAPEMAPMPHCHMAWVPKGTRDPYPAEASLSAPVYLSLSRETLLTNVSLPCSRGEQDKWILGGVAVFLT